MSKPEEKWPLEFDPFSSIRPDLSPEHANLDAGEMSFANMSSGKKTREFGT